MHYRKLSEGGKAKMFYVNNGIIALFCDRKKLLEGVNYSMIVNEENIWILAYLKKCTFFIFVFTFKYVQKLKLIMPWLIPLWSFTSFREYMFKMTWLSKKLCLQIQGPLPSSNFYHHALVTFKFNFRPCI